MGGAGGGAAEVLGEITCPELSGGAMNASFESDAKANGTIRAFVTASGDLASIAARVQAEVGAACERMGPWVAPRLAEARSNGSSRPCRSR